jgi:hypothetical protein
MKRGWFTILAILFVCSLANGQTSTPTPTDTPTVTPLIHLASAAGKEVMQSAECTEDVLSASKTVQVFADHPLDVFVYSMTAIIEQGTPSYSSSLYGGASISSITPSVEIYIYAPNSSSSPIPLVDSVRSSAYENLILPVITNNIDLAGISEIQQINSSTYKSTVIFEKIFGQAIRIRRDSDQELRVRFQGDWSGFTTNQYVFKGRRR